MESILHIILLVVGFIAVIVAAYLVTRFLGYRTVQATSSRYMKVVDRIFIGSDKSICLVQVGNQFYLVGITNHHIGCIAELEEKDLIPLQQKQVTFGGLLNRYIKIHENSDKEQESPIDMNKIEVENLEE